MSILATDNFTRANNTDLGTAWDENTGETGPNGLDISANKAIPSTLLSDNSETNNSVTWPDDQYVTVTFGATFADGAGSGLGGTLREATGATVTYYRFIGNSSGCEIGRKVNGGFTSLAVITSTTFASGPTRIIADRRSGPRRQNTAFPSPPNIALRTSGIGGPP